MASHFLRGSVFWQIPLPGHGCQSKYGWVGAGCVRHGVPFEMHRPQDSRQPQPGRVRADRNPMPEEDRL